MRAAASLVDRRPPPRRPPDRRAPGVRKDASARARARCVALARQPRRRHAAPLGKVAQGPRSRVRRTRSVASRNVLTRRTTLPTLPTRPRTRRTARSDAPTDVGCGLLHGFRSLPPAWLRERSRLPTGCRRRRDRLDARWRRPHRLSSRTAAPHLGGTLLDQTTASLRECVFPLKTKPLASAKLRSVTAAGLRAPMLSAWPTSTGACAARLLIRVLADRLFHDGLQEARGPPRRRAPSGDPVHFRQVAVEYESAMAGPARRWERLPYLTLPDAPSARRQARAQTRDAAS